MAGKIFINYRRDDSIGMAGRLHDRLAQAFGRDNLFMDVDHIPAGADFVAHLNSQVAACQAMLVVIGPTWLTAKDESGGRRLDSPDDFVVVEIAAALARDIPVIPVLVDGARMPNASQLPDALKSLARRQTVEVRHARFGHDAKALVLMMDRVLGADAARRRRIRIGIGAAALAALLLLGWSGYTYIARMLTTVEQVAERQKAEFVAELERQAREKATNEARQKEEETERQRLADLKTKQVRDAREAAAAEERRKDEEAERRRLADLKAREAAAAEQRRKDEEAERQRVADFKAKQDREAREAAAAEQKRKDEEAERVRLAAVKAEEGRERVRADALVRYGTLMEQGARYNNAGNFDGAIASFSDAIQLDPKAVLPFHQRAFAYEHKGDRGRALADYNEALRLEPGGNYSAEIRAAVLRLSLPTFAAAENPQAPGAATADAPSPGLPGATTGCDNPNVLGVSRKVEIDAAGGPGFGFQTFKVFDFLRDREIVLTFDDGPWAETTPAVLKALADQCTKAMFFPIGKHAGYYPQILKQVAAAGHTVGSHTWSHRDLSKLNEQEARDEIEKGIAAVGIALGNQPVAPFFRFPALAHPPQMVKYLGERNVAIFSTDIDSDDFMLGVPDDVVASVMKRLDAQRKGIIRMHDFQKATAAAAPALLRKLKEYGYKVVQVVGKAPLQPQQRYTSMVLKEMN